nr:class F sortase [Amycolatopsis anabasis]
MLIGVAAVVVVAAVVALVVFTGGNGDPVADNGRQVPIAPSAGQQAEGQRALGQQPGTIRLPEGGTAQLVRRELTADGTLPIPEGLNEATWWGVKLGADHGASLLSGHVNWKGKKGPFDELWRVRDGQQVSVVDTAGGHWVYKVNDIVTIHKSKLASRAEELFGQDGPHRLVLVTCGGDYIGGTDGYEDNRIVSAELVSRP